MSKKLNLFYRISKYFVLTLILTFLLVKGSIWFSAVKDMQENRGSPIKIRRGIGRQKFTSEKKQKVFYGIDNLLRPAVVMVFIVLAVKFINDPDIFAIKNERRKNE